MNIPVFLIDTFSTERFKGSPTAVCYLESGLATKHLLAITRELNFPVTAFVIGGHAQSYSIRYFTQLTEIAACGHATLGAAAVIEKLTGKKEITFRTAMDARLSVSRRGDVLCMTYPRYWMNYYKASDALLQSLQVKTYKSMQICEELETLFIEVQNATQLRSIAPDFKQLLACDDPVKEVVITCAAEEAPYDFLLRSFCPWIGIDEDPVTGSIHSALAPYWASKLQKTKLQAYQASQRGGVVGLQVKEDVVQIEGSSVFVLQGQLQLTSASPVSVRRMAESGIEIAL